jgi:hypothetical protein
VNDYELRCSLRVRHWPVQYIASSCHGLIRRALEVRATEGEGSDLLDTPSKWPSIVCRQKRESGQKLRNAGGFLVSFIKDEAVRRRLFSAEHENSTIAGLPPA